MRLTGAGVARACFLWNNALMTKSKIRGQMRILAAEFNGYRRAASKISRKIIFSRQFKKSDTVLAYMALPDEADISKVIKKAIKAGKSVYIPKVFAETGRMEFFRLTEITRTESGAFGIQEPAGKIGTEFQPQNADSRTLVLVPGRAFTKNGKRLGRGGGFYDKYLPRLKNKARIAGVCLQFQLVDDLPADEHDIRMDFIFLG